MRVADIKVPKSRLELPSVAAEEVDKALAYSPTLRRLAAETLSADAEIESRKSALWPRLSLRHEQLWGRYTRPSQNYVVFSMQTGNGLSAITAISEAESLRSASTQRESNTRLEIGTSVRTDWNKVLSSKAETEVLLELADTTRDMYESFVRQYAAGRKFWLDVLNARSESIKARNSLVDAEWDGRLAIWRLQIATGVLSPQSLNMVRPEAGGTPDADQTMHIDMAEP
jgi:adhesin transport system outer membrane protein